MWIVLAQDKFSNKGNFVQKRERYVYFLLSNLSVFKRLKLVVYDDKPSLNLTLIKYSFKSSFVWEFWFENFDSKD